MVSTSRQLWCTGIAALALLAAGCDGGGSQPPSLQVASPNGGETLHFDGLQYEIAWTSSGVATNVNIYYTPDNRATWKTAALDVANTGSYTWDVPDEDGAQCLVRIEQVGGGLIDESDDYFTITPATVAVTQPNGGEEWRMGSAQTITWTASGLAEVDIELSRNNGFAWEPIATATPDDGSYDWTVAGTQTITALIRVSDATEVPDGTPNDVSDAVFNLSRILVTIPNGGETWYYQGEGHYVRWSSWGVSANVDIHWSDNGTDWYEVALDQPNTGLYSWDAPDVDSDACLVRVREAGGAAGTLSDISDAPFSIHAATITGVSPSGGEGWLAESQQTISWTASGVTDVRIDVSRNGGTSWQTIGTFDATLGSYDWTVAWPSSINCMVRVADASDTDNSGRSAAPFTIGPLFVDTGAPLTGVTSCAAAWGDYDGDGDLDLVIAGSSTSGLTSDAYKCTGGVFARDDTSSGILTGAYLVDMAFGDYDNDGDVDLAISGQGGGTRLYATNGSVLSEVASAFPMGVGESAVAWGDFDLDGDLDLAYSGANGASLYSDIFRNTAGSFTYASPPLTNVSWGDLDWGDYDRDSIVDLLLAGESGSGNVTEVYGNSGGALTVDAGVSLVGVGISRSAAAWGDYDNDGWLDVALAGATTLSYPYSPTCRIYRNVAGTFTDIGAALSGVWACSLDWGDYDNDGDLDLVVSGRQGTSWITRIYRNDAGTFVNTQAEVVNVGRSSVAWGDYDDDGDLDLAIVGSTSESVHVARIYRNDVAAGNTPPTAPANLSTDPPTGGEVTFKWDSSSDDSQTPADGLSYNLRVGTSSGGSEVCSGMADTNGRRLIPVRGPIQPGQSGNSVTLTLPAGTYRWSVQAVDTGFEGSAWAAEETVTVP